MWTIDLLRRLLNQYIAVRENAQRRVNNARGNIFQRNNFQGRQTNRSPMNPDATGNQPSVETFAANVERKRIAPHNPCVFCKGDHFNDECESFKSLTEHKQKLLTQGRCFLCFKAGHTFKDCLSIQRYSCHYCGKRGHHNRAVCPQKFGGQSVEVAQNDAVSDTVAISTDNSNNQPSEIINSTSIASDQVLVASGEKVLLQTANVSIQMADGSTIMARVLLDSASHRTFMTGKLATQLKLKPQQRELLSVSTFAAKTPKDVDTYVVNFNLITKDQSVLQLSAYVINKITGLIQRGPLQPSDLEILLSISPEKWLTLFLVIQSLVMLIY